MDMLPSRPTEKPPPDWRCLTNKVKAVLRWARFSFPAGRVPDHQGASASTHPHDASHIIHEALAGSSASDESASPPAWPGKSLRIQHRFISPFNIVLLAGLASDQPCRRAAYARSVAPSWQIDSGTHHLRTPLRVLSPVQRLTV